MSLRFGAAEPRRGAENDPQDVGWPKAEGLSEHPAVDEESVVDVLVKLSRLVIDTPKSMTSKSIPCAYWNMARSPSMCAPSLEMV